MCFSIVCVHFIPNPVDIYFIVPDPVVEMSIEYDWYELDDTAVISCSAEFNGSVVSYINGAVSLLMSINGVPLDVYQSSNDSSIITSGALLLQLPNIYFAREYTCRAYLTSDSLFIEESNIMSSKSSLRIQRKFLDLLFLPIFNNFFLYSS